MIKQIEHLIDSFNTGWTQGKFEILNAILHEKVVFIAPDLQTEITGIEACINTLKDYTENARTKLFEVRKKKIYIWQLTASISLDYYIEYDMNHETYKEKGKEFWTLNHHDNNWKLVWRAMVKNERLN